MRTSTALSLTAPVLGNWDDTQEGVVDLAEPDKPTYDELLEQIDTLQGQLDAAYQMAERYGTDEELEEFRAAVGWQLGDLDLFLPQPALVAVGVERGAQRLPSVVPLLVLGVLAREAERQPLGLVLGDRVALGDEPLDHPPLVDALTQIRQFEFSGHLQLSLLGCDQPAGGAQHAHAVVDDRRLERDGVEFDPDGIARLQPPDDRLDLVAERDDSGSAQLLPREPPAAAEPLKPLKERSFTPIDRDNFNDVMDKAKDALGGFFGGGDK